jgi:hypothetical protein
LVKNTNLGEHVFKQVIDENLVGEKQFAEN